MGDQAGASPAGEIREPLLAAEAGRAGEDVPLAASSSKEDSKQEWGGTVMTLLALQLGWGLWLLPFDFARLGWIPGVVAVLTLAGLTMYSGSMYQRLKLSVTNVVLFGDVGEAAYGAWGRGVVYAIIYSLDATRCIILHLAATESLQHVVDRSDVSMWLYGGIVFVFAIVMVQAQSLAKLSWFCTVGTTSQLFAVLIVMAKLVFNPLKGAHTELVKTDNPSASLIAILNIIFAYGGQFAFVEIMNSMRRPNLFVRAITACTGIMTAAYLALGLVGYSSQGDSVAEIVIFSLAKDVWSRAATAALLVQALAQYLVNINVWAHNVCTLVARWRGGGTCSAEKAGDHHHLWWLCCTAGVVGYSYVLCILVPFFSELVGLVTAVTYLACAYTLPCLFLLKLNRGRQSALESGFQMLLIPCAVVLSCIGLYSSLSEIIRQIAGEV